MPKLELGDPLTKCPLCKSENSILAYYEDIDGDYDIEYVWSVDCLNCGQRPSGRYRLNRNSPVGTTEQEPPLFDPDPELIAHLEGNTRSLRGYRRKAEEMRADALPTVADIDPSTGDHGSTVFFSPKVQASPASEALNPFAKPAGAPILPPNAYRTHLPLPLIGDIDPATVRAVAEQVQKLLEDIVRESPHP